MNKIRIEDIKEAFSNNYDVKYREIKSKRGSIHLVFIDNLCDSKYISDFILSPLLNHVEEIYDIEVVANNIIAATSVEEVDKVEDAITHVLTGNAVILFPFLNKMITCPAKGFVKRAIDIPTSETVIKGPREGFTENISDNISSIRRRIKTPKLKTEHMVLGEQSKTSIAIIYIEGIAPEKLVQYIREKIMKVSKKDFMMYQNHIEEELRCKRTAFETIGYTEKPDVVASKLSEGRVAVVTDGTAFVMTAPYFFIENFQTTDDYTLDKYTANEGRIMRWSSFFMSTLAPGLYLALVSYHSKLIPSVYTFKMAMLRAGVPVPAPVELLYMTFFFQIIREAGVRLPQPIGPTLSIVGALILGQAAVVSGLASQITVVIVAITSIASYLTPKIYSAVFTWNIIIVIFSGLLGIPGYFIGLIIFITHLSGLTSCGYPYLYPLGTMNTFKYRDVIFRGDLQSISKSVLIKDDGQ